MEKTTIILNAIGAFSGFWAAFYVANSYVKANPHKPILNSMYLLLFLLAILTGFRRLYVLWRPAEMQFWFWFITPTIVAVCVVWVKIIKEFKRHNDKLL